MWNVPIVWKIGLIDCVLVFVGQWRDAAHLCVLLAIWPSSSVVKLQLPATVISLDKLLSPEDVAGLWSFSGYPGHNTCLPVTGLLVESILVLENDDPRWVGLSKIPRRYLMPNKIPCGSPPRVRPMCHRLYPVSPICILWRFRLRTELVPICNPICNLSYNPSHQVWSFIGWKEDHESSSRFVLFSENSRKICI